VVGLTVNRGIDAANGPWSCTRVVAAVIPVTDLSGRMIPVLLVSVASSRVGGDLEGGVL